MEQYLKSIVVFTIFAPLLIALYKNIFKHSSDRMFLGLAIISNFICSAFFLYYIYFTKTFDNIILNYTWLTEPYTTYNIGLDQRSSIQYFFVSLSILIWFALKKRTSHFNPNFILPILSLNCLFLYSYNLSLAFMTLEFIFFYIVIYHNRLHEKQKTFNTQLIGSILFISAATMSYMNPMQVIMPTNDLVPMLLLSGLLIKVFDLLELITKKDYSHDLEFFSFITILSIIPLFFEKYIYRFFEYILQQNKIFLYFVSILTMVKFIKLFISSQKTTAIISCLLINCAINYYLYSNFEQSKINWWVFYASSAFLFSTFIITKQGRVS